ncbi:MAG: prolyl oligopeptidase family serine peptidase, partial [Bacteroidaceae bacterium]|nr:prolyl oligopeptidase family serine peptidase [Bacteroidaceae bacterium]
NIDSLKPAFQILFYPVISMEKGITHQGSRDNLLGTAPTQELIDNYCNEKRVTSTTPRAFIVLSDDDTAVPPTNSAQYYIALKKAGVPASLHIYPSGGHGFGYRTSFKYHAEMVKELSEWLESF